LGEIIVKDAEYSVGEEVVRLQVAPDQAGERLDRYVTRTIDTISRSYARQLIEDGHIQLNKRFTKPSQPVRSGDVILVRRPVAQPTDIEPEVIPLNIVYEDADVVVVDKAAGMVVHPAPGHTRGTLVNALLARYPDMQVSGNLRPGIVHRLDQDTSGLLVVARNDQAMRIITEQQKARTMHKAYLSVIDGRMKELAGVIDAPIGRHPVDRKRQTISARGRSARTHYQVLEELGDYTLIEARLETGRTHQIRVHFASRSRPVLGDQMYGPRKPRATFGLKRQFLHAYKLGFTLPSSGTWREFTSPLPEDLQTVLAKLRTVAHTR
jgi:23S rRNA pseudouridine1911/1915/1917 synthase